MVEQSAAGLHPAVNGPDDGNLDWHSIDWVKAEANVRRLRQRIFAASQAGDLAKVRNLQKLMLRSHSNTLVSVKRVTQVSGGRKTAGIDGETALTPTARGALAQDLHRSSQPWRARPVKRVLIPKANGKQRPLGIPVIRDRVQQARVKNALEPEWEARFEQKSYGFRPGRSCHDAIETIYSTVSRKSAKRVWVLDADLSAAFDNINHDYLLEQVGSFPAKGLIRAWLKAGVVEKGMVLRTEEGTPQGGVVSPLLLNVALHGMEMAAGVRYYAPRQNGPRAGLAETRPDSPVLVRYADDFVVLCETEEQAYAAKDRLAEWLAPRGLVINEEKTSVRHLREGFDFLGFNIRKYERSNDKLLIKPSKDAVRRIRKRLTEEVRSLHGSNELAVIRRLSPIIRGWSAYYRTGTSSETFTAIDYHLQWLLWRWARRQHPKKGGWWVKARYFARFNKSRDDNWVFGHRESGTHLVKFAWTSITRHAAVRGGASPDDPALAQYWRDRRRKATPPPLDKRAYALAVRQKGLCPGCQQWLIEDVQFEADGVRRWIDWFATSVKRLQRDHFVVEAQDGGPDELWNLRLLHGECHRQITELARRARERGCATPGAPHSALLWRLRQT